MISSNVKLGICVGKKAFQSTQCKRTKVYKIGPGQITRLMPIERTWTRKSFEACSIFGLPPDDRSASFQSIRQNDEKSYGEF